MFRLVESAPLAPGGCMVCRGTKNLCDLMQEFSAQQLRLYICELHAKEVARVYGWLPGPEQEKLMLVRDELQAKEREYSELDEKHTSLRADFSALIDRCEAEIAAHKQSVERAEQLQTQLDQVRQASEATLAAVTEPDYEPALD